MRRIVLILFITLLHLSAYSQQSRLSIYKKNSSVRDILKEVEERSDYFFLYKNEEIDANRRVDIELENITIERLLDHLFEGTNIKYKIVNRQIVLVNDIVEQLTVSGKVVNSLGQALPGVNVIIKGTTRGTITDTNGDYSIKDVSVDETLNFSFIGMKAQEIKVSGKTTINVQLEQVPISIEEVVTIGYGIQKKVNLTGSVADIEGEKLLNRAVTGTVDALQGMLPGVVVTRSSGSPGLEEYGILIRGITSVNENPVLVLIDGIEGEIEDVRPEDIESISVLKDAASASIYGAKAAGGVILITTKRGNSGKISVALNSYFSLSSLGRTQERISSYQAALLRNEADINTGSSATVNEVALNKLKDPDFLWEPSPTNPKLFAFYGDYNYKDLVLKDFTPMMSHNIAISGGSENIVFRMSATYYENSGMIKIGPDGNKKYSAKLNLDFRINEYFQLDNVFSFTNNYVKKPFDDTDGNYGIFSYIFTLPGATPLYDPNGHLTLGERIGNFDTRIKFYKFDYEHGIREWNENNLRYSSTLSVNNLIDGLRFRIVGGIDFDFNKYFHHEKLIKKYGIDGTPVGVISWGSSVLRKQFSEDYKELQFLVDYDFQVNDHSLLFLSGYSIQNYRSLSFNALAKDLVNEDLADFDWAGIENSELNDEIQTNRFQSLFGRIAYNFKNRYLLETNIRYDGSSKLSPQNQYKLFPSFSAAWKINKEDWFKNDLVTELKLRSSYGQLGNAGVLGNYDYISLLKVANDLLIGTNGTTELQQQYVYQQALASKNISWEIVKSFNVGIDLAIFENKLRLTGDYFIKNNKNMLAEVDFPSVIGLEVGNMNLGRLKTWGWETNIEWKENKNDFRYWINAQISDAENKLVEYYGANVISPGTVRLLEGMSVNSIYGYRTDGLFQYDDEVAAHSFQDNRTEAGDVKYLDLNNDGKISAGKQTVGDHGDLVYLGNSNPRYSFGIQGGFRYKDFDFSLFFQGVGKRTMMLNDILIVPFVAPWFGPQKHQLDYWTPENRDAFWPRLYLRGTHNYLPSDKWIQNAAYVRLKDLQIGYTLPYRLVEKAGIDNLRFYIAGHDIWEATNVLDVIDPETPNQATFMYPFKRSYTVGVSINF